MKNTRIEPSGKLALSEFILRTCIKNDLNNAYFIIRSKCPVSFKQVKQAYNYINN